MSVLKVNKITDLAGNQLLPFVNTTASYDVPVGTVIPIAWYRTAAVIPGYLPADGSLLSTTSYPELYAVIGSTYGASGNNMFRLPDLRGEFIRGYDAGRGVDSGRTFGSSQASQNLSHTHGVADPGHFHTWNFYQNSWNSGTSGNVCLATNQGTTNRNTSTAVTNISVVASGGTEARPRNVALMYWIKYA